MAGLTETTVKNHLDLLVARNRVPGIQYIVVDSSNIRFQHQIGLADLASGKPVLSNTTFMASSSTKVMTAAAVLQLVEKGNLGLDDPVSAHYSRHPYGENVTIRHLLTQTSGIPNPMPLKWIHLVSEHSEFNEELELQSVLQRYPRLNFKPGQRYQYSNLSYWLLGKVVESISGCSFSDFLRSSIFDPLDIQSSDAGFTIADLSRHATGYQTKFSAMGLLLYVLMDRRMLRETVHGRFSFFPVYMNGQAYGGLICTAMAFAKFLQDFLRPTPKLMSASMKDLFLKPQADSNGRDIRMTLGWRSGLVEDHAYYGKAGGGPGFRSNVRLYPEKGIGTAWFANETGVNEQEMNLISDAIDRAWLK